jgi:SagB-type dehydrogenase family enzyme
MNPHGAAAVGGLLLGCALSACAPKHDGFQGQRIRELNQIPLAQLRVMLKGFPGDWRPDGALSSSKPEPPSQKPIPEGATRIALALPESNKLGGQSVRDAIAERRSVRHFSATEISKESLGFLLWATQGVTGVERDPSGKVLRSYRAAPSAGGRYPLETYLAVQRVQGLPAGLYRYLPNNHELLLIREDSSLPPQIQSACYNEPATKDAAVVFIWSATPLRTEWKYAYLAHRMIALEAGHVCENLYLAAQSSQLGACALLSYHQPALDGLLGLDGVDEFVVYLACVGKAAEPSR